MMRGQTPNIFFLEPPLVVPLLVKRQFELMSSNRLKLNADTIRLNSSGSAHVKSTPLVIGDQSILPLSRSEKFATSASFSTVTQLTMEPHVMKVVQNCFYQPISCSPFGDNWPLMLGEHCRSLRSFRVVSTTATPSAVYKALVRHASGTSARRPRANLSGRAGLCSHGSVENSNELSRSSFHIAASVTWNSLPQHPCLPPSLKDGFGVLKTHLFHAARYDFLLVFYSDFRYGWNWCRVI